MKKVRRGGVLIARWRSKQFAASNLQEPGSTGVGALCIFCQQVVSVSRLSERALQRTGAQRASLPACLHV